MDDPGEARNLSAEQPEKIERAASGIGKETPKM
jgi:hypothetical protein